MVRLRVYPGFGHLAPPALGDSDDLQPDYERRMFVQITLSQAAAAITLLALAAAVVVWAVARVGAVGAAERAARTAGRDGAALIAFFGLCLGWLVYAVNSFVRDIPVPAGLWWALVHSAVDAFYALLACFFHRLLGLQRPRLERVLGLAALACALFYLSAPLPVLARLNPWLHALTSLTGLYLIAWLGARAWRRRERSSALYVLAVLATVLIGVHDQLLNALLLPDWWRQRTYLSHLMVPLLFLVMAGHLAQRVARSIQAERALAGERERIWRDLHDHVGARLLSLVHGARDADQAALARDALAQMRRLVDASRSRGGTLADLAAEWQVECELRCEQAGIGLHFDSSGDAVIGARERDAIEGCLRELVSNAIRHAGARHLQVRLGSTAAAVMLEVSDDGTGLPAPVPPGHGLANIRRRVDELGGQIAWSVAPGGGTRCRIELPSAAAWGAPA